MLPHILKRFACPGALPSAISRFAWQPQRYRSTYHKPLVLAKKILSIVIAAFFL